MLRKQQKNHLELANVKKNWKETPPGPEQKELERLFSEKIITEADAPNNIRQKNPLFMQFSAKVFGLHFRKTKAKYGLYAKNNEADFENEIPELGLEGEKNNFSNSAINKDNIEFVNFPVSTWMYTDHEEKCNFVYVALPMISGATNINFNISEDGLKVSVNYDWPCSTFQPKELFRDEINNSEKKFTINHPKIHAFTSHLLDKDITEKSRPRGNIIVTLPVEVQREDGTWKKRGVKKPDGTKIVLLELKAYQENKIIADADTSINFE